MLINNWISNRQTMAVACPLDKNTFIVYGIQIILLETYLMYCFQLFKLGFDKESMTINIFFIALFI